VGPGLISWSEEQASVKKGLGGLIARHQAGLFFPLTCLEALSLHVDSFKTMRAKGTRQASLEMALLSTHLVVLVSVLFLVLPPWHALAFLVVQQAGFGLYLGCAFAPNHKGMPMPQPGEHMSFVHRQVTTSRNVKGGRALATALGGLNYQIEHHLFPSLPMANLPRCEPLVRRYCAANAIPYAEAGLIASYAMALRHLRDSGRQVVGGSGEPLWRDS
jgi:fatty acid desaturase